MTNFKHNIQQKTIDWQVLIAKLNDNKNKYKNNKNKNTVKPISNELVKDNNFYIYTNVLLQVPWKTIPKC